MVSIDSDKLHESDLQNLQFARYHLRNFMRMVNLTAAEQGATPQQGLGIPDTDSESDVVQIAILARQAEQMGMVVSDDAIIDWLTRYAQGKLGPGDFARILRDVTQGRMSQNQFFDAMRRELLAQQYLGIQQEGMMPPTPAGIWDYFLRLNRQISFEAVPFQVSDYLAQVDEPSEDEILALYEEGKNRYPFPDRPDPGFKRLKRVAVQYVKADLANYLEEAKADITDEEVQRYYETNKEEFRNIDLPNFGTPSLLGDELEATTTPADAADETTDAPDAATPSISEPPAADDASDLPDEQPLQDDPEAVGPKQNAAPEPDLELPDDDGISAADALPENEDAPVDQAEAAIDQTIEESEATEANPTEEFDVSTPADEPPSAGEEDPLKGLPEAAGNNAGESRPEYKPLDEVADDIRTRLATPIARQKMDQALAAVRSEMKAYFGNYLAWDVSPDRDSTPQPTPPDLRPLAQQYGLTVGNIPLVTIFQLQETDPVTGDALYEISRAYDTNYTPFAQYMFSEDLRLYEVRSIRGQVLDTEYLYWKTDEVPERVPELSEVRDEIVRAWKMKQALELAKQDAQQAAERLNQSNQRPLDVYANDPNRKVVEVDSVTWMTSMGVPYLPPRLTRLPGIKYPGDDFMRSVFSLSPGHAGIAVDNPQDTVYVVAVTDVDSDEEQLREQFLRTGTSQETALLAQRESQRHLQDWYASLEKKLNVKWQRDPLPDTRSR